MTTCFMAELSLLRKTDVTSCVPKMWKVYCICKNVGEPFMKNFIMASGFHGIVGMQFFIFFSLHERFS